MADTIRTGIVGATVTQGGSGWGANAHVPALHILPDYELKAVCTASPSTTSTPWCITPRSTSSPSASGCLGIKTS
jgi:predicted dehydrogenase